MNVAALLLTVVYEAFEAAGKLKARAQAAGVWSPEAEAEAARRYEAGYAKHAAAPPPPPGFQEPTP